MSAMGRVGACADAEDDASAQAKVPNARAASERRERLIVVG